MYPVIIGRSRLCAAESDSQVPNIEEGLLEGGNNLFSLRKQDIALVLVKGLPIDVLQGLNFTSWRATYCGYMLSFACCT